MRTKLFGERFIREGPGGVIQLEVPSRPDNAAAVPISIKSAVPQSLERYVKNLFIVVDNNPEPLVGTFYLTPESGLGDLATNIRVMTHGPVRAIAEMNNGDLFMSSQFVKASGGCAIAPSQSVATASESVGQMLMRAQYGGILNQPHWLQLIITHPNYTGLQHDAVKGHPIPAHFIKALTVRYGDTTIMAAVTGISISEDPTFRFYYIPRGPGAVKAEVTDSRGLTFTRSLELPSQ